MQGLRIIFFPTILILRYFYSHQLIGIFPESFFMNARPEAERPISTFNFPFLFFGLGRSSVNHGSLFCLSCSVCASCCCLLLLCSRVPSPAVLSCPFSCCAVRASSSSLPAELTRPFFFCTSSRALGVHVVNSLLHSLALSLAHATSLSPPCSIDFSLCGLTGSFCRLPRPISPSN